MKFIFCFDPFSRYKGWFFAGGMNAALLVRIPITKESLDKVKESTHYSLSATNYLKETSRNFWQDQFSVYPQALNSELNINDSLNYTRYTVKEVQHWKMGKSEERKVTIFSRGSKEENQYALTIPNLFPEFSCNQGRIFWLTPGTSVPFPRAMIYVKYRVSKSSIIEF